MHLYFLTAAAEPTFAKAIFYFRCRSRARFCRSHFLFQMPQQSTRPQKPHSISDAAELHASAEPFPVFPYCHSSSRSLKETLSLSFSSEGFHRSQLLFPDTTTTKHTPMTSSTPLTLSLAFLGGHKRSYLDAVLFNFFGGGSLWGRVKHRARTPLHGQWESPGLRSLAELGALSLDSTPNTHKLYSVWFICECELVKYLFGNLKHNVLLFLKVW